MLGRHNRVYAILKGQMQLLTEQFGIWELMTRGMMCLYRKSGELCSEGYTQCLADHLSRRANSHRCAIALEVDSLSFRPLNGVRMAVTLPG